MWKTNMPNHLLCLFYFSIKENLLYDHYILLKNFITIIFWVISLENTHILSIYQTVPHLLVFLK